MRTHRLGLAIFVLTSAIHSLSVADAADYQDADAAFRDGTTKLRAMQFDEARSALEASLKIAPDDAFRFKVYQALTPVYRRLPDAAPMIEAQEFMIERSERHVERRLAARGLVNFLFQRGLLDQNVTRWEERLTKNADDLLALSTLTAAYDGAKRNDARREELLPRLTAIEQKRSAAQAEQFEKQAAAKPAQAALLWKEAAEAWRDAGNKEKALVAAAEAGQAAPPDGILLHFYHRGIGEVYADCGKNSEAVAHLEKAVAATTIKGYQEECQARIDKLRSLQVP